MFNKLFTKLNLSWLGIVLSITLLVVAYSYLPRSNSNQDVATEQGLNNSAISMIEYADLLCESCVDAHVNTLPRIRDEYVATGKVDHTIKLVNKIAPDSLRAAQGALCAQDEGKYIEFIDAAYNQLATDAQNRRVSPAESTIYSSAQIGDLADEIDINRSVFEQCVESGSYEDEVMATTKEFDDLERVYGTPHFIIGGKGYTGAPPYEVFKATIEDSLKR